MTTRKSPEELRSYRWFGPDDLRGFGHRSRSHADGLRSPGLGGQADHRDHQYLVRPQPLPRALQAARRGREARRAAGGRLSDGAAGDLALRAFVKPTTMLYRNFLAMETEELIRSHPVDGVVLMGGCDKTTPGLIMGATSAGLPAIFVPAGPMLRGNWQVRSSAPARMPGSTGTSGAPARSPKQDWLEIEAGIARSHGTCMTMGTAPP